MGHARFQANANVICPDGILCDFERKIHIAITPGEAWSGYADDRVGFADQLDPLAHNAGVRVEVALPELVAEDDNGLWILTVDGVGRNYSAAQCRGDTKENEAIGGQVDSLGVFRKIASGDGQAPIIFRECIFYDR